MGILEKLAELRESLETSPGTDKEVSSQVEAIAQEHFDNLGELYANEQFEDFKKSTVGLLLALSNLTDLLFYEEMDVNLQECIFITTSIGTFFRHCPMFLRTENGIKLYESFSLILSKLLGRLNARGSQEGDSIETKLFLLEDSLSGLAEYRKKSFRYLYVIPTFNTFANNAIGELTASIADNAVEVTKKLLRRVESIFSLFLSLYQYEENFKILIGASLTGLIAAIKQKLGKAAKRAGKVGAQSNEERDGVLDSNVYKHCTEILNIRSDDF